MTTLPKNDEKACPNKRLKRRHEHAPDSNKADVSRNILAVGPVEAADLRFFLGISANDAHTGKIFLDASGERGEPRLNAFAQAGSVVSPHSTRSSTPPPRRHNA